MEFELSETQRKLRDQVGAFVEERIIGENLEWDGDENFPREEVYRPAAEMGLTGMLLPYEAGGQDLDYLTAGLLFEQIGRGDVGLGLLLMGQNSLTNLLYEKGDEHQREVASEAAEGRTILAFGATEPEHGSDLRGLRARATPGDGEWVLNGKKTACTGLQLADYVVTLARIGDDDGSDDNGGDEIGLFLVPVEEDGVDVAPYHGMGCEVEGWGQLFLDDVTLAEDARIGDRDGFKMAMEMFDMTRPWISLYTLGAAQQTLDETKTYLTEREAFGKPLAAFEGPMFEVAEMETKLDCLRLKAYEALWRADEGKDCVKEAAMVKWWAPEVAADVVEQCLVLHGHYGYSKDFGIEKRLRDVVGQRIADGTPHVQKLILGREIFGREYLPY